MKLFDNIKHAFVYSLSNSRNNIFIFAFKIIIYIIPAIILGHYTDIIVKSLQTRKTLGDQVVHYVLIQTFLNITSLYLLVYFLTKFSNEFQKSIAGGYFIVLYFGMQTNYIEILQQYMLEQHVL